MNKESRRERRRKNLSGQTIPTLDIISRFSVKENGGKPKFRYWNRDNGDKGEEVFFNNQIEGILIGEAMQFSAYDNENEVMYNSSMYLRKNNKIALFKKGNKVASGTLENLEKYLVSEGVSQIKKRWIYIILTKTGLISVETNVSIAIDQIKQIKKNNKDAFIDNFIVLKPDVYDPDDKYFSQGLHKRMKITKAKKNYPFFARIEVGDEISENDFDEYNEEFYAEQFTEWTDFIMADGYEKVDNDGETYNENSKSKDSFVENGDDMESDETDDLPF